MKPVSTNYGSKAKSILNISEFKGVDLQNSPPNVDESRSPDAPNMIRDVPGKVRKRMGYHKIAEYDGRINGVHQLNGVEIIHAGTKLYKENTVLYSGMADTRSTGFQVEKRFYLLDGEHYLCYDGTTVKAVSELAYVPTIVDARSPKVKNGVTLEPINLLGKKWTEGYIGTASDTVYQLSFGNLDNTPVTVQKLKADGSWQTLIEGTNFSVNRTTGEVTFTTAPGESPISGHTNIKITASRTWKEYAGRIEKCDICTLFGVGGAADRLFVTGNPDFKNYDWYSQMNDPTYFGDTWYSVLGQDSARIIGYSMVGGQLAAHKGPGESGRNIILRKGTLTANVGASEAERSQVAAFPISDTLQGEAAIAKYSFAYLVNEPLYLSALGICALALTDATGERYCQNRSFYLNKALCDEAGLSDAYGIVYKDFYLLSVNNKVYLLDSLVKSYERGMPYSTHQYEGYYFTGIDARVLWQKNGALRFGTSDGKIMEFYTNPEAQESYQDNGAPIAAHWDLPELDGKQFYKNKTFRRIAVRLASAPATGVDIDVQKKGLWYSLYRDLAKARYFLWSRITWSKFSWCSDTTPHTISAKIKVKKVDKARYRLKNENLNEPFGIYNVALEFTESGYYKG